VSRAAVHTDGAAVQPRADLPARVLPVVCAVLAVCLPYTYLAPSPAVGLLSPANVAVALCLVVARPRLGLLPGHAVAFLAAYLVVISVFQDVGPPALSLLWSVAVVVVVLLPGYVPRGRLATGGLTTTWVVLGFVLSCYAVVEYALETNPLAGLFRGGEYPLLQHWSVYRATTVIGHPLLNGTFFAMTGAVAGALVFGARRRLGLLLLAASAAGELVTASRGGVFAFVAGVGASWLLSLRGRAKLRVLALGSVVVVAVSTVAQLGWGPLAARSGSVEAAQSFVVRDHILRGVAEAGERSSFLGQGPGLSGAIWLERSGALGRLVVESSFLQLVLSVGLPGLALMGLLVAVTFTRAVRAGAVIGPSVLVAYLASATTYNLFEGYPALLALAGVALVWTASEVAPRPVGAPAPPAAEVRTTQVRTVQVPNRDPRGRRPGDTDGDDADPHVQQRGDRTPVPAEHRAPERPAQDGGGGQWFH
jgi:hypothetical protein